MADIQYITAAGDNAGVNYNSFTAWAAQNRDLVTEANGGIILRVKNDFGGKLVDQLVVTTSWVSDASNPIVVLPDTLADGHQGVENAGFILNNTCNTVTHVFRVEGSNHVTVQDFTIEMVGTTNNNPIMNCQTTPVTQCIRMMLLSNKTAAGQGRGIIYSTGTEGGGMLLDSCLIKSTDPTKQICLYFASTTQDALVVNNCTIVGWSWGSYGSGTATPVHTNTTIVDCSSGAWGTNGSYATSLNCAADDGTAPTGGTAIQDISLADGVDFEAPSSGNYKPQSGGKLDGAGIDNSASGYTTDIADVTRS